MKKTKITNTITVWLEGYGEVQFEEQPTGTWHLNLDPRFSENDHEQLLIGVPMTGGGTFYGRIESVFKEPEL